MSRIGFNFTQHNIYLPYQGMQTRDSPAFSAQRQVFPGQATSIEPVPMPEATTGPSSQNTANLQNSQSIFTPPFYPAPFVPFTYGMPPAFSQTYNLQYPATLRQILPKPQVVEDSQSSSSTSRPPDFITHVQSIRQLCGINETHEPPREGQAYLKWRKLVIQQGKPVSTQPFYLSPGVFSLRKRFK